MNKILIIAFFLSSTNFAFGQKQKKVALKDIAINYFGELGFKPGVEVDMGMNLWSRESKKSKSIM